VALAFLVKEAGKGGEMGVEGCLVAEEAEELEPNQSFPEAIALLEPSSKYSGLLNSAEDKISDRPQKDYGTWHLAVVSPER
jgi:hypothetical protein